MISKISYFGTPELDLKMDRERVRLLTGQFIFHN